MLLLMQLHRTLSAMPSFLIRFVPISLFVFAAYAQTSTVGTITGAIFDPGSQPVSGATVQTQSVASSESFTVQSGASGLYRFARLPPGEYVISVEKQGFRRTVTQVVTVRVNEVAVVDVNLPLGSVTESVSVQADTPLVQSQTTELSSLVDERRVRELPLNGKNFQRLIALAPGVGAGGVTNPAINGARASMNNYTFDGNTANDERTPNGIALNGGAATNFDGDAPPNPGPNLISTEAIQEYRVITTNADASFGRGSGAQINVITKSGSNEWHGSAHEFLRNDKLDARDFFNNGPFFDAQGRSVPPPFKQNLFGGTFGGRLVRKKHFIFGNYEGYRQRLQQTSAATVANAALVNLIPGDLGKLYSTYFIERGVIPASGNPPGSFAPLPAAQRQAAVAAGFPSALFDGSAGNGEAGTVLLSTAPIRDFDQDSFTVRTDHRLGNRWNLFGRYAFAQPRQTTAVGIPDDVTTTRQRWQQALVQSTVTLTPVQVLELRAGVQRSVSVSGPRAGLTHGLLRLGSTRPLDW